MPNTTRLIVNQNWIPISFTPSELNSLPSGGAALSATISNSTLDICADVSFFVKVGGTTNANGYLSLYVLPLLHDGLTFGDGYVSSRSSQPCDYCVGSVNVPAGVASGGVVSGRFPSFRPPVDDYKLVFANNLKITLYATAGLDMKIKTYNENLNV